MPNLKRTAAFVKIQEKLTHNTQLLFKYFFGLSEKIRYLLIGGINTAFGFTVFSILYLIFYDKIHYIIVLVLTNFIAVCFSYIMLKVFVFQTKGNYLREFLRCYFVYLMILLLNSILLFLFVDIFHLNVIFSQFVITILLIVGSYISHKFFSFKVSNISSL